MVLTQEERRMACLSSNDEIQELLKLRDESNNLYEQTGLDREIQNALFVNKFYKGSEAHHFNCHLIHSPRKIAKMAALRDNGWISDAVGPSDDILKTIYNEYSITRPRSRNAASARAELPQNWRERSVNCIYYAPAVSNQEAETSERRLVAKVDITYDPDYEIFTLDDLIKSEDPDEMPVCYSEDDDGFKDRVLDYHMRQEYNKYLRECEGESDESDGDSLNSDTPPIEVIIEPGSNGAFVLRLRRVQGPTSDSVPGTSSGN